MSDWSGGVDLKPGDEVKLPDGAVKMIGEVYPAVDAQKPKLCINCKWFPGNDPERRQLKPTGYAIRKEPMTCFHKWSLLSASLIDGEERRATCEEMRGGACGAQGSLYEAAIGEWMDLRGSPFLIEFVPFAHKKERLRQMEEELEARRIRNRDAFRLPRPLPPLPEKEVDGVLQKFRKWMQS